ncbi:ABC1 kinase family protein [Ancrocorticia populi]|uniref:ABC1 kinase family protein n=1 Tax=Ancrocorticia populi TaxID=2175228 RepID=UPI0030B8571C
MDALSFLYQALTTLLVAAVFTVVIKRLLPAVGWIRAYLVSLLTLIALIPVSVWAGTALGIFTDEGALAVAPGIALVTGAIILLWIFAVALLALVVVELIVPTGTFGGPIEGIVESRLGIRRLRRYLQLGWIVMRSGLGRALRYGPESSEFVTALIRMINSAGVTFVKFGQLLSTRSDLLPAPLITALSSLQTSAAPASSEDIRETLLNEWDAEPDAIFAHFDPDPFAAASVAQVHRATLKDGRRVVVKVQRPGAAEQVQVDCDILLRFARTAQKRFEWADRLGLLALIGGLVDSLNEELDYDIEVRNTTAIARSLKGHPLITAPTIIPELSTKRVLVMTELQGAPVPSAVASTETAQRDELASELFSATAESILIHGVFHADLHPGNIMLLQDETIGLLDFGAIGVIDAETRQLLASLLLAIFTDDNVNAVASILMAFDVDPDIDRSALQRDLGRVLTVLGHRQEADATIFSDVFAVLREYGISIPGDVAGAFRTLASLDITLQTLRPGYGLFQAAQEALPHLVTTLSSPERLAKIAATSALTSAIAARRLPARAERLTTQLERGELTLRARSFAASSDREWFGSVVDDILSGAFACIAIVMALVFLLVPSTVHITTVLTLHHLIAGVLGFIGITLALRLIIRLFARRAG